MRAVEILLDLIGMHPGLDLTAPLMQSVRMEGHHAVGSDTSVTFVGKLHKRKPSQYALYSRRIPGASHLVAKRASELKVQTGRWN